MITAIVIIVGFPIGWFIGLWSMDGNERQRQVAACVLTVVLGLCVIGMAFEASTP